MKKLIKVVLLAVTLSSFVAVVNADENRMQIIIVGPDSEGITNVGFCFTNPSELAGAVSYNTVGFGGSGGFLKHSGTPACPTFAAVSWGYRITAGVTYSYSATATNNGKSYSASTTYTAPANASTPTPTPTTSATSVATSSPTPTPTPTRTSTPTVVENDGTEDAPVASIDVVKRASGKYLLEINSNISDERLIIRATKKGKSTISYSANTDDSGDVSILTSRNLIGYTLTLRYEGRVMDKILVRR